MMRKMRIKSSRLYRCTLASKTMGIIGSLCWSRNRKVVPSESFQATLATMMVQALLKACARWGSISEIGFGAIP